MIFLVRPEKTMHKLDNTPPPANNNGLIPIFPDEDFAFFAPGPEIPDFVDEVIELFLKHSKVFYVILIVQFVLDVVFNVLTFYYRHETFKEVLYFF